MQKYSILKSSSLKQRIKINKIFIYVFIYSQIINSIKRLNICLISWSILLILYCKRIPVPSEWSDTFNLIRWHTKLLAISMITYLITLAIYILLKLYSITINNIIKIFKLIILIYNWYLSK